MVKIRIDYNENYYKIMVGLNDLSPENLGKIHKVLKIVSDALEIQEINHPEGNKIPLKKFEKENISYGEVVFIVDKINKEAGETIVEVLNESLKYENLRKDDRLKDLLQLESEDTGIEFIEFSKKDVDENIIFKIKNQNKLREIKKDTDKKIFNLNSEILQGAIDNQAVAQKGDLLCPVPKNTHWEDITIKFKNDFDVEIFIKEKFLKKCNNEHLGFYSGAKQKSPDRQWRFLILLSTFQGEYEKDATKNEIALSLTTKLGKKISINNCEKIERALSKKLSEIFGIDGDSFYSYKEFGYYKPKFILAAIPIMRGSGEVYIRPHENYNDEFGYKNIKSEDGFEKI